MVAFCRAVLAAAGGRAGALIGSAAVIAMPAAAILPARGRGAAAVD